MRMVLGWMVCGVVLGLFWVGFPWAAQPVDKTSIEKKIDVLQQDIQSIKKTLEEIKANLGQKADQPQVRVAPELAPERVVSLDDDPQKGDPRASIILIEFSDYQCPFCGRFFRMTFPDIENDYIETGKIRYVFRDFPLPFHQQAMKAAEAAQCAGDQGKYWEMHDRLFQTQDALMVDNLKNDARDLDLSMDLFNSCLDSGKYTEEVQKDVTEGQNAGVSGTPSFFLGVTEDGKTIKGKLMVGAKPFDSFKQEIDALLSSPTRPQSPGR